MRVVVEGVTVDRQRLRDNQEPVNYALERETLFRLYSGKSVLNKIVWLEHRVFESCGLNPDFFLYKNIARHSMFANVWLHGMVLYSPKMYLCYSNWCVSINDR